ncbi:MAG: hypothetical protein R6U25_07000 [Alkalispirochaeta sp.]
MSSQPSFSGVALALAGAAVLPTLLILQLILTRSGALLAPLRVALALQLIGSAVTVAQVAGGYASLLEPSVTTIGLAGILFLLDAVSLLFLLSYTPQSSRRDPEAPSRERPDQPQISVEEVSVEEVSAEEVSVEEVSAEEVSAEEVSAEEVSAEEVEDQ